MAKRNKYDEDEILQQGFKKEDFKRLGTYIAPYKRKIILSLILIFISSIVSLLGPLLIKNAMDVQIPNNNIVGLMIVSVLYFISIVVLSIIMRHRMYIMSEVGQNILVDIRRDLFINIQRVSFNYFDSRPHGKILTRVVNYINSLSDVLSNGFVNLLADMFTLVITIIFMMYLNFQLTLITLTGIPILLAVMLLLSRLQRKAHQRLSSKESNMNAYIHESINGIKVTQMFSREEENKIVYRDVCTEYSRAHISALKLNLLVWPSIETISILSVAGIYVYSILILDNTVSIGLLTAFISYVWTFWFPITNIGNFYNTFINSMAYLERIFEAMDEEPERDIDNPLELIDTHGRIEFKNVSFEYEEGNPILENISFDIKGGEKVALVGPTGAGKTTIVNLISRFYKATKGNVLIDDFNINDISLSSLRNNIGVMMQDPFIFSGTIIENIRYGRLDATEEEIIEVAKIVKAHDFIMEFEDGYYTEVKEQGNRLSVGQRQLISFARVLLANPKILILDEATSSIDTETELLLQQGLEVLMKNRTSIVIAHRLSTIVNSNKIMYISDKKVLESGTHEELLRQKGEYYSLYKSQFTIV